MELKCLVAPGEKGSPENPVTLDELGPFLSKLSGRDVKVRGFIPPGTNKIKIKPGGDHAELLNRQLG